MSHVHPDEDEEPKVWGDERVVEIVQRFGGCEEEVRAVVSEKDGDTNPGEVETVGESNQRDSDDMMKNKLLKVGPRLLQLQHQHYCLLEPVGGLQEVISLEVGRVGTVRVVFVEGTCAERIECPHLRAVEDPEPVRCENEKVQSRVSLFHEARYFTLLENTTAVRKRPQHSLHQEFAGKAEEKGVEQHEVNIFGSLCILLGSGVLLVVRVRPNGIGKEDCTVERVGLSRIEEISEYDEDEDDQWVHYKEVSLPHNPKVSFWRGHLHQVLRYDASL